MSVAELFSITQDETHGFLLYFNKNFVLNYQSLNVQFYGNDHFTLDFFTLGLRS